MAAALAVTASRPAEAATGDISTVAGGLGRGVATNVSQRPLAVAVKGPLVYTAEWRLVRVLDVRTGISRVIAGDGRSGEDGKGDGGPATAASFELLAGIAVDDAGNVYVSDDRDDRIRRIGTDGIITTFAGGGASGADGVRATDAAVGGPLGLAFDPAGNLHVATGARVRRIDAAGRITTVAGVGTHGYSGDGGPATNAEISPDGIAFDPAGNLYIADNGNSRVRRVGPDAVITTIAGSGSIYRPHVEGGRATEAWLVYPEAVAVRDGSVYVNSQDRVVRIDPAGTLTTVVRDEGSGTGPDRHSGTGLPLDADGLAFDAAGRLYVADETNARLQRVEEGNLVTVAGNRRSAYGGDGGPAVDAQLHGMTRMAYDRAGNLYIADNFYDVVRRIDPAGTITTVATFAPVDISAVAVDPSGRLLVGQPLEFRVVRLEPSGAQTVVAGGRQGDGGDGGPATEAEMQSPMALEFDDAGNLFILDYNNWDGYDYGQVRKVDTAGIITTVVESGQGIWNCRGGDMAFDAAGRLVVTTRIGLMRYDLAGGATHVAGGGEAGYWAGEPVGDGGPATDAHLLCPGGVTADAAGNIYVTDNDHRSVRRINPAGVISTVAGGGDRYPGDGGPATSADLPHSKYYDWHYGDLVLDGRGGLVFGAGDRIRRVEAPGSLPTPTTTTSTTSTTTTVAPTTTSTTSTTVVPTSPTFHSLAPARILDTRSASAIGPGSTLDVTVTGVGGVPGSGVSAVALNMTVTQPTAAGHLTVHASGTPRPVVSNLNFAAGQTVANLVMARVGANGKVSVYNHSGASHVVLDVVGWYGTGAPGTRYNPLTPARLLDTRTTSSAVGEGGTATVAATGVAGVPATGVSAVVLNVTATQPTAAGYLTLFPNGTARPLASSLNFTAGATVPNLVVAKVGPDGKVAVYNHWGTTHVVVDVMGWFGAEGDVYTPATATRIVDSRNGTGGLSRAAGPAETVSVTVSGQAGVPAGATAVVVNVTAVQPTAAGYLTVFPAGAPRPLASNLNFVAGQTVANLVVATVGADGRISVYNPTGSTHLVVDLVGWFS